MFYPMNITLMINNYWLTVRFYELLIYIHMIIWYIIYTNFKNMDDSSAEKTCSTHKKPYQFICLD